MELIPFTIQNQDPFDRDLYNPNQWGRSQRGIFVNHMCRQKMA